MDMAKETPGLTEAREGEVGSAKGWFAPGWPRRWALAFWREWVKPILAVVIVLGAFRSAVADWNDVPSGSMRPTILPGDRIFVNKMAYDLRIPLTSWSLLRWGAPARGDVVICYSPEDGTRLVKRVVGLPGDSIEYRDNALLINGSPVAQSAYQPMESDEGGEEAGAKTRSRSKEWVSTELLGDHAHPVLMLPQKPAMRNFGPIIVPADSYFMMGDNRDDSRDSRMIGFVSRDEIVGKATYVVVSVDPSRYYLPRFNRWFSALP